MHAFFLVVIVVLVSSILIAISIKRTSKSVHLKHLSSILVLLISNQKF